MPLAELDLARIESWCEGRIPPQHRDEVRVETTHRGMSVTVFECRAPWDPEIPDWSRTKVAQLRNGPAPDQWTLYCADGNGRWHRFEPAPTGTLVELLEEIERDSTGIFWG